MARNITISRPFSTQLARCRPQQAKQGSNSNNPAPGEPEIPSFSLDSLGLSKNMKMLVVGLVCVFGTIETWFWCQAIWRWWKGGEGEEPART